MAGWLQKWLVFVSLYISYMLYVYVRRSVTFAMPDIVSMEGLHKNQMGLILSCQMLSYAISKFFCGVLMDAISPKLALATGLLGCGVTVVTFASVPSSQWLFAGLWLLNGLAGGPGWPAAAIIMKKWFKTDQFGTAWSVLSTSMNVAGMVGPMVTAYMVTYHGWRASLIIPGVLAAGMAGVVLVTVQDKPASDMPQDTKNTDNKDCSEDKKISRLGLLNVPGFLGVCITYGVVSLVQYGTLQWGPMYLVNDLGHSLIEGNSYVSSLEVGGICGSLIAGYYSDHLLTQNRGHPPQLIRQFVIAWFISGLAVFLYLLAFCVTRFSSVIWINMVGFGLGMTIYGPVSIYGVAAMESVPSHLSGTAHAVAGLFSTGGQTFAGLPLSVVAEWFGLQTAFQLQLLLVIQAAAYLFFYTSYRRPAVSIDTSYRRPAVSIDTSYRRPAVSIDKKGR